MAWSKFVKNILDLFTEEFKILEKSIRIREMIFFFFLQKYAEKLCTCKLIKEQKVYEENMNS